MKNKDIIENNQDINNEVNESDAEKVSGGGKKLKCIRCGATDILVGDIYGRYYCTECYEKIKR
jgi:late competence protein required for DNA uptake (superfamily II DNA/RNA helicase)